MENIFYIIGFVFSFASILIQIYVYIRRKENIKKTKRQLDLLLKIK